jgi:LuxR family transcriptional regulator, maltose regulon positive regulatory protein
MPAPIAKINRPRLSEVFPRKRIFRLLDLAVERPIVWVSAPAGSGKSTLIASWLDARKLPSLWYQVDEGDGDIATFFYYLGLAAKKAAPHQRKPLPLLTPEYLQGISTFSRRYFEKLFSRLKTPCVLVFDNFQEVPPDSSFQEVIRDGVSVVPPGVNIIFISRSAPSGAMTPLKVGRLMATLGWEDIRLTLDETAGIVALQSQEEIGTESIRRMHRIAQGWMAGIILMTESVPSGDEPVSLAGNMNLAEIFDYFAEEILAKTTPAVREFLLKSSLLPMMTAKTAGMLTGLERPEQILSHLVRQHYFTHKYAHSEPVYQYHPLFREFLLSLLRDAYPEPEISGLHRQAAVILADSGNFEDAAEHLRAAEGWVEFVPLVLSHAQSLMMQGRIKTLDEWVRSIPAEIVQNTPWLLYWQGVCRLPYAPAESRRLLEGAYQGFIEQKDAAGELLSWAGLVDTFVFEWNDFTPLDRWLDLMEERVGRGLSFPSRELEARVSSAMVCALMWRRPGAPGLNGWVERALRHSKEIGNPELRMQTCFNAANYHLWMGNLAESAMIIKEIGSLAHASGASPLMLISWKWIETAQTVCTATSADDAIHQVEEGLAMAADSGVRLWDHMLYALGVFSALSQGETATGEAYLRKMEGTLVASRGHSFCHYHYLAAWHAFLTGSAGRALVHAERALDLAIETGFPFPEILARLAVAQGAHETGAHLKASEQLNRAGELISGTGSSFQRFMHLMTEAQVALDLAGEAAALPFLRDGFSLGRRKGFFTMFWWWRPTVMARLCCKAIEAGIEVDYVQEIVRRRGLTPHAPPVHIENWPWPLRIYTLGRFGIIKDGEPLRFTGKVQQKPLSLLKVIIALGGREVPVDKLLDVLWPEAEGDVAHQAFTTALHRLRRLLENDKAIQLHDGRVSLDSRSCWLDVWAFERLAGEVDTAWRDAPPGKDPSQAFRAMKKTEDLYTGHFLAGEPNQHWVVSLRERLRAKIIHLIGRAGACHEQLQNWKAALQCYQKGLTVDDHLEEFHQRVMVCHFRLGRPGEALAAFDRCRRILATIGMRPSRQTMAMHDALLDCREPEALSGH